MNSQPISCRLGGMLLILVFALLALPLSAQMVPLSASSDDAYLAAYPNTAPGTIYFNTTTRVDRAYDGATWHDLWTPTSAPAPVPTPAPAPVTAPVPISVLTPAPAPTSMATAGLSLGDHGDLHGFKPFEGAPWTQAVTNVAIDSDYTARWVKENGSSYVHLDFGRQYGMPYIVADGTMTTPAMVSVKSTLSEATPAESDLVAAPIPFASPIEGLPPDGTLNGDNHLIVVRRDDASLIELYHAMVQPDGSYSSDSTALWDLTSSNPVRPFGFTSADAAGLPIFPFLVKHEEFLNPVIGNVNFIDVPTLGHALRMSANNIRAAYYATGDAYGAIIAPASHSAPNNSSTTNIEGMRLRLDPGYDTSGLGGLALVIANTLKVYGCIIADLGSTGYITGTMDEQWTDVDTTSPGIPLSAFQVVAFDHVYSTHEPNLAEVRSDLTGKVLGPPVGTAPVISSFTWNNGTLSWQVTGANYLFIDKIGLVRGNSINAPAGNYTLTASNLYGRAVTSLSTPQ